MQRWVGTYLKPTKPVAVKPTNGQQNYAEVGLVWACDGADFYDLYGSTDRSLVTGARAEVRIANDTFATSFDLTGKTQPNTVYYWMVVAFNRAGATKSDVFSFKTASAPSLPVDCVISEPTFGAWEPVTAWTACAGGQQTRSEQRTWTKSIVTAPANGGAACGPLSGIETRTATQACTDPGGGGGTKRVLVPGDLVFKGFYRFDPYTEGYYSRGGFTSRVVNGKRQFFALGNETQGNELIEYGLPSADPAPDVASAPFMPKIKSWGMPFTKTLTGGGNNSSWLGGLHWDESKQAIFYTYGEGYIPTGHDPSIGAVQLKADGTTATFGNWRTKWNSQKTRGAFCEIPQAFADAHLSGKRTGMMSTQASGNFHSPFGAILSAVNLPALNTPPDGATDYADWSVDNHGLILHDYQHRQTRDTRFKTCGWNVKYDCRQGSFIKPGLGLFGGEDPAAGQDDTMNSCIWIDLPDKHGLLYFGQLVTTPQGYQAPGDPDGFVHLWYGDPFRSDGSAAKTCCHGQFDDWWQGTGPGAHLRVPLAWIYNPDDLIATAKGTADLWSRVPTTNQFEVRHLVPTLGVSTQWTAGVFGGVVFDAATRRLYVPLRTADRVTHPPHGRYAVMVFEVV
jgi:hypothetical protein